jgi:hypothetical protein
MIMRERQARPLSGLGRTQWRKDRVLHSEDDRYVPGTSVARLTPIRLGKRFVGYDADEVDAQNRALIAHSRSALAEPVDSTDLAGGLKAPPPFAQAPESRRRRRRLRQRPTTAEASRASS